MKPQIAKLLTIGLGASLVTTAAMAAPPEIETTETTETTKSAQPEQLTGALVKGSQVLGVKLYNQNGEDIGEINDFLFDENKGAIAFGILAIGGWLEMGENLVVVPWKHIKQSEGDEPGFILNGNKAMFESAPHFLDSDWPEMDDEWIDTSFTFYDLEGDQFEGVKLVRATDVIGTELWNQEADQIGEVNDIILHPNTGKVAYGVVDIGDWAGYDDNMATVPWSLIRQSKGDSPGYVLNVDKAKLTETVFFDENSWPDYSDPNWNADMYEYYGQPAFWTYPVVY